LKEISILCGDTFFRDSDGSIRSHPLISISELQRLKKEYGETLILHGRNYPFITDLPDINEYKFKIYPQFKTEERELPKIVLYDAEKVIKSIIDQQRHLPFSIEVCGKKTYYSEVVKKPEKNNVLDW